MIPRYSRPEMDAVWRAENRLALWLEVELAAAEAMAEIGRLPAEPVRRLRAACEAKKAAILDPGRVEAIERVTRHDVIAFLTHVEEVTGEDARFLHLGMTSSDLLDTTFALQLVRACDLMLIGVDTLLDALRRRAFEHKDDVCIGRSHGVHAEPTTFGVKLAGFHAEFARARRRLVTARDEIGTCALSGAVGTFATVEPEVEELVAARLGLKPEPVSTQVIPRDRHAAFFAALGVIASSVERLATEVRHLQRSEVREAEEFFAPGQKGSSAMPHKRNPVLTENLTGLARIVRAAVVPALENVALWHERDISHSSVERVFAPDATIALDFALTRLADVVDRLVVYPERMRANLESLHGLVFSQRVLLALAEAGLPRQRAYEIVQRHAMRAWREDRALLELLLEEKEVTEQIAPDALTALFDLGYHTKHVGTIFARVFGNGG